MAYRRLPNTDKARIEAVKVLLIKVNQKGSADIITIHQIQILKKNQLLFTKLIKQRQSIQTNRKLENSKKQQLLNQLKLYISHFFQVLNFAIIRKEINKSSREYFGVNVNSAGIPSLQNEKSIIKWGGKLILGESERIQKGAITFSHPHIATIEYILNQTIQCQLDLQQIELKNSQLQSTIKKEQKRMDDCIKKAWNDIEFYFKDGSIIDKRKKAIQYGVIYIQD